MGWHSGSGCFIGPASLLGPVDGRLFSNPITNKPKKIGYYNRQLAKTRRALGIRAVLGRMTNLRKKTCSVHDATNNWMIAISDGKARGHKMMSDKIIELDQLLIPFSHMTKNEVKKFMK